MPALTGTAVPVALGEASYAILAPGLRGQATLTRPPDAATRARSRSRDDGTAALDQALAATHLTEVRRVEIALQPGAGPAAAGVLRGGAGEETIELQVPDLGPEVGQIVLAVDENDALTWHLPVDAGLQVQPPAVRGGGGVKRFRIAARPAPAAPASGAPAQRSLLGSLGRKLLKVLVYPITDPICGAIGAAFASRWEAGHRAPLLRAMTPANRQVPRDAALGAADWSRLGSGRALLLVHGTFSTSHGAFGAMPDAVFEALFQRYEGRVFAYDHPTLATDPVENVRWLLGQVPAGVQLEVDIICHSRGGLVARTLAEHPAVFGLDTAAWQVRRLALVAVPNQGTPLADGEHMVAMIDRLTTALNLAPSGPVVETLEVLITAVKVVGHGALASLTGLAAMRPGCDTLAQLNSGAPDGSGYRAVAVNFEPQGGALGAAVGQRLADHVLDVVFRDAPNDLVVPEEGVWSANGNAAFPIAAAALLRVPASAGIIHTTVFGHPPVCESLLAWLD
jgi:hypothetical protein